MNQLSPIYLSGNNIYNLAPGVNSTDAANMANLAMYAKLSGATFTGLVTFSSGISTTTGLFSGPTAYGGAIITGVTSAEYGTGEINRQITGSAVGAGNNFSTWYRGSTKIGFYGYSDTTTDILYYNNLLGNVSINTAIFSLTGGLSTTTGTFSGALIASGATIGGTSSGLAGLQVNAQTGASGGYTTAQFGATLSLFIQQGTNLNEIASNNYLNGTSRTSLSNGYSHAIQFNTASGTLIFANSLSSLSGGTSNPINSNSLTLDKSGNAAFLGGVTVGSQSQSSLAGLTVLKLQGATGGYTIAQFGSAIPLFLQQSGTATVNEISSNSYLSGTTRTVATAGYASLLAMSTVDGSFIFYSTGNNAALATPSFNQLAKIDNTGNLTIAGALTATGNAACNNLTTNSANLNQTLYINNAQPTISFQNAAGTVQQANIFTASSNFYIDLKVASTVFNVRNSAAAVLFSVDSGGNGTLASLSAINGTFTGGIKVGTTTNGSANSVISSANVTGTPSNKYQLLNIGLTNQISFGAESLGSSQINFNLNIAPSAANYTLNEAGYGGCLYYIQSSGLFGFQATSSTSTAGASISTNNLFTVDKLGNAIHAGNVTATSVININGGQATLYFNNGAGTLQAAIFTAPSGLYADLHLASTTFNVRNAGGSNLFQVDYSGNGTFTAGVTATTGAFSGALSVGSLNISGSFSASTISCSSITVANAISAYSGVFNSSISAATGTFSGNVTALSGMFSGQVSGSTGSFTSTGSTVNPLVVTGASANGTGVSIASSASAGTLLRVTISGLLTNDPNSSASGTSPGWGIAGYSASYKGNAAGKTVIASSTNSGIFLGTLTSDTTGGNPSSFPKIAFGVIGSDGTYAYSYEVAKFSQNRGNLMLFGGVATGIGHDSTQADSGDTLQVYGTGLFTGMLSAPTAPTGTSTLQVATTAYVMTAIGGSSTSGKYLNYSQVTNTSSTSTPLYYNVLTTDDVISCTNTQSNGGIVILLPAPASNAGKVYTIKRYFGVNGASNISLQINNQSLNGALIEGINGTGYSAMALPSNNSSGQSQTFISDGTNYQLLYMK